jgi:hypothetical protein
MKIINTRLHGIMDYVTAFVLILPWICMFNVKGSDTLIFTSLAAITALYSMFTDYEFGLIRLLPMKVHLVLDVAVAGTLIATPWLFPVTHYLFYWPVLLGILEIAIITFSSPDPYRKSQSDLDITRP